MSTMCQRQKKRKKEKKKKRQEKQFTVSKEKKSLFN